MFKRIFSFIMITALVVNLSACGGSKSTKETMETNTPNYEEKEIGSKSNIKAPGGSRINSKNQLVVYDRGSGSPWYAILDSDGNPVGEIKGDFKGDGSVFALDSSDNLYVVVRNSQPENGMSLQLCIINPKGETLKTVNLKTAAAGKNNMPNMGIVDIAVDSNGNAYLVKPQENIEVIDKNGQSVKTIGSQDYWGICMDQDDNIIAVSRSVQNGGSTLEKISASTGKSIWKQEIMAGNGSFRIGGQTRIGYLKSDKSIYLVDDSGVKMYDSQGKPAGTVLDFTSFAILSSGYNITDFAVDSSKNIYVITMAMQMSKGVGGGKVKKGEAQEAEGTQNKSASSNVVSVQPSADVKFEIYKYTPQTGEKAAEQKKTITISAKSSDRILQTAASKFQKDNPDYKINIEAPPTGQSSEDREKYINALNTQILSGKGPDIIFTGWLPYEKYVSKNTLANLSELMAKDKNFDSSKYYSNIFDGMKINKNIYALPITFSFSAFIANTDILAKNSITIDDSKWTWTDFREIAQKVTDSKTGRTALPNVSYSDLLDMVTRGNYGNFVDRQAKKSKFNSHEFIDMLNIVKSFGDGKIASKGTKQDMGEILDAAQRGALVFYPQNISDYMFWGLFKNVFNDKLSLFDFPSEGNGSSGEFSSDNSYGISNSSKYKEKAWEFLKILLSDDIQSSMELRGFSVNKEAQQKKAQQVMDMTGNGNIKVMMGSSSSSKPIAPSQITQADVDYINNIINGLKTYTSVDTNIANIVQDETKAFFSGSKTAEEVARLIQNRVDTYLGE
mgnify:CR=1 FL=1